MKTVRLSRSLNWDIEKAAGNKYDSSNPAKEYPQDGMPTFIELGYQQKIDATFTHFKQTWGYDCPSSYVEKLVISSTAFTMDDDGNKTDDAYEQTFHLALPSQKAPAMLVKWGDEMRVKVESDNPTFLECMDIKMFNDNREQAKRQYLLKIREVLGRFGTLNQLLKAAPYMKDVVPQDKLQKMHEKDDRSGRVTAQAELADNELSELREVLLEDALLGDD